MEKIYQYTLCTLDLLTEIKIQSKCHSNDECQRCCWGYFFDYTDYHLHVNIRFLLRVMIYRLAVCIQYSFGKLVIRFESFIGELMLDQIKKIRTSLNVKWSTWSILSLITHNTFSYLFFSC